MRGYRLYENLDAQENLSGEQLDYVNRLNESVSISRIFQMVRDYENSRFEDAARKISYRIDCDGEIHLRNYYDIMIIMRNLLDNGLQCGADQVMAKIDINQDETKLILTIADNGPGLDENVKQQLFTPHYVIPYEGGYKTKGLGFYNVRKAVIDSCGHFSISALPGKGTICTIVIPLGIHLVSKDEIRTDY